MKTGGILSRLTGDIDTTAGLLQMAIVSPAVSVVPLTVAVLLMTPAFTCACVTTNVAVHVALAPGARLVTVYVATTRARDPDAMNVYTSNRAPGLNFTSMAPGRLSLGVMTFTLSGRRSACRFSSRACMASRSCRSTTARG